MEKRMKTNRAPTCPARLLPLWLLLALSSEPVAADIACTANAESCSGDYSSIFAIAHDWQKPVTDILYRVTVPAWSTGDAGLDNTADWTGKHNGFFYQAIVTTTDSTGTQSSSSSYYVPFNGIRINTNGKPEIPAFHFIVLTEVVDENGTDLSPSLQIKACSSDYESSVADPAFPNCTTQYWSETYASTSTNTLPSPQASDCTPDFQSPLSLPKNSLDIADSGVYTDSLTLNIDDTNYDSDCLDWLNDHLVFFDSAGKAYTKLLCGSGRGPLLR
jgi:hypothetical protein